MRGIFHVLRKVANTTLSLQLLSTVFANKTLKTVSNAAIADEARNTEFAHEIAEYEIIQ